MTDVRPPEVSADHWADAQDSRSRLRVANLALLTITLGTLAVSIDSTMVNVALPAIRDDLRPGGDAAWVVTGYFLGTVAVMPATGWLSQRFGYRRPFVLGLAGFAAASVLAASAWSLPVLVLARCLQGAACGPLLPLGMAIVMHTFPVDRRGRALSLWSLAALAGPALGPTVGGRLTDLVSWRCLFAVDAPFSLLAIVLALRCLPTIGTTSRVPLDLAGLVLGAGGLAGVLVGLGRGPRWGWTATGTLVLLVGGTLALAAFTAHELRVERPLLELRVLRRVRFVHGASLTFLSSVVMTSRMVFVPLQLADVRGYPATRIGLLLAPVALSTGITVVAGGRAVDRVGPRRPILAGMCVMAGSTAAMAAWTPSTPDVVLFATMAAQSMGNGLLMGTGAVYAMSALRVHELSQGATVRQVVQQLGSTLSAAVLAVILAARMHGGSGPVHTQAAYGRVNEVVAALVVIGVVAAWRIPKGVVRPVDAPPDRST